MMSKSNLLAYLAIHCRVYSISTLSLTLDCKKVIKEMYDEIFPLEEWNEAVHYLCGINDIAFTNEKEAKEYLLNFKIDEKTTVDQ